MTEINPERELLPFAHLHIPKTAGTSLRRAFRDTYGPNRILYYDNTAGRVIRSRFHLSGSETDHVDTMKQSVYQNRLFRAALPLFKTVRASENLLAFPPRKIPRKNFDVLTGHFNSNQITDWGLQDLPVVTLVREPLDRAWSQYNHWRRTEGKAGFVPEDFIPFDDAVSFESFALQDELSNYQVRTLGSLSIRLTGVVEALPEFLEELGINQTPWVNMGTYESKPDFAKSFIQEFTSANMQDYELYHTTVDAWGVESLAVAHSS